MWLSCTALLLWPFLSLRVFPISEKGISVWATADRTHDQYKRLNDYLATGGDFWLTDCLVHCPFGAETTQRSSTTAAHPSHTLKHNCLLVEGRAVGASPHVWFHPLKLKKPPSQARFIIFLVFTGVTDFINWESVCLLQLILWVSSENQVMENQMMENQYLLSVSFSS